MRVVVDARDVAASVLVLNSGDLGQHVDGVVEGPLTSRCRRLSRARLEHCWASTWMRLRSEAVSGSEVSIDEPDRLAADRQRDDS